MKVDVVSKMWGENNNVELQLLRVEEIHPGEAHVKEVLAHLDVRYFDDDEPRAGEIDRVVIRMPSTGITPSALQRFAWAKWLAMADHVYRLLHNADRATHERFGSYPDGPDSFIEWGPFPKPSDKRPGRRGHPREHYERVAARYLQLRSEGANDPTARIAREWQYSRNTVAGWVRRCRELGLLPPGRKGRPG